MVVAHAPSRPAGLSAGAPGVPATHALQVPLLEPTGLAALAELARDRALFAFDFDGTLAGIRARPSEVRVAPALARRMAALARARPVAIVTGRRIADVRARLGFEPAFVVGNHGAEDDTDPEGGERIARALEPLRVAITARELELEVAGVLVEDKRQSIAMHFRNASDRGGASALIEEVLELRGPDVQVFGGKLVYNAVAVGAPDKAHAVQRLLARAGARTAFFAGDDLNDEPVFECAEPGWVTVRVGREHRPSQARFSLESPRTMVGVIDHLLSCMEEASWTTARSEPPG
jgi:trehalose 6-phosphate phosphatase